MGLTFSYNNNLMNYGILFCSHVIVHDNKNKIHFIIL